MYSQLFETGGLRGPMNSRVRALRLAMGLVMAAGLLGRPSPAHGLDFVLSYDSPVPQNLRPAIDHAAALWHSWIANVGSGKANNVEIRISYTADTGLADSSCSWFGHTGGLALTPAQYMIQTGSDLKSNDGVIRFTSLEPWYTGLDGKPPSDEFDLVTVALHEIGHQMGVYDSYGYQASGRWGIREGMFGAYHLTRWDTFLRDAGGDALAAYPAAESFDENADGPAFVGPQAMAANGGKAVGVCGLVGGEFRPGSSLVHILEPGKRDALMEYAIAPGEANPGLYDFEVGVLKDLGWSLVSPAAVHARGDKTRSWHFGAAWLEGLPPESGTDAYLDAAATSSYDVFIAKGATAGRVVIAGAGRLRLDSGGRLTAQEVAIGSGGAGGTFRWNGGALAVGTILLGAGGRLEVDLTAQYAGTLNLEGGTLDVASGRTFTISGPFGETVDGATLTKAGAGVLTINGPQNHRPGTTLAAAEGRVDLNTDAGGANLAVALSGSAAVNFGATQHLAALNVAGGTATLAGGGAKVLVTKGLTIDPAAGKVDLVDNDLIVDYDGGAEGVPSAALENVKQWLAAGFAGMSWTGRGIVSSAAAADPITFGVGYAQNDMLFAPYDVFSGETVDPSSVLVKFTYAGDMNLDGCVDDNDVTFFNLFYDGGITTSHYWNEGDIFGYDGRIDDNDVTILNLTYGAGWLWGAPLGGNPTAVPEPGTLALAAFGALGALAGRRRNRVPTRRCATRRYCGTRTAPGSAPPRRGRSAPPA